MLGLNLPSDYTLTQPAEGGATLLGATSYPASLNWVTSGAITTQIKNQASCGDCYAFSTAAAVQGAWFIKHGVQIGFGEQQLLDCSGSYCNAGCGGGLMTNCYNYLMAHTYATNAVYTYVAYQQSCKYNAANGIMTVNGYKNIASNAMAHMAAIQIGPISIGVAASTFAFQSYKSGILTASSGCGTALDHAVTLVGYGTLNG